MTIDRSGIPSTRELVIRGMAVADEAERLYPLVGQQGSVEDRLAHHERRVEFYRVAVAADIPEAEAELAYHRGVLVELRAEAGLSVGDEND
ncbi:hypothetical protein ACJ6WD_35515 [Streptomyces sp. VTCC 41912]|uniref:hypothetical protein n=1 Tax=Streptomyces sp. VTCC 41912 TaxID=3383243 RepID=UPI0038969D8B